MNWLTPDDPARSTTTVAERTSSGMPSRIVGQRVGDDRDLRGVRIDVDPRAHHLLTEVEGARFAVHDDRDAEGAAAVGAGEVDRIFLPARLRHGNRTRPSPRRRREMPDLARRGARARRRLLFAAERDPREHPEQARRSLHAHLAELLVLVAARDARHERAEATSLVAFGASVKGRRKAATAARFDLERRDRRGDGGCPRPRRKPRARRVGPAIGRHQRRARPAEELQLQIAERQLRLAFERGLASEDRRAVAVEGRRELTGKRVRMDVARKLDVDAFAFVFHDYIDRQQTVEWVLFLLRQVNRAFQGLFQQAAWWPQRRRP